MNRTVTSTRNGDVLLVVGPPVDAEPDDITPGTLYVRNAYSATTFTVKEKFTTPGGDFDRAVADYEAQQEAGKPSAAEQRRAEQDAAAESFEKQLRKEAREDRRYYSKGKW
jgi:hypothetical protein